MPPRSPVGNGAPSDPWSNSVPALRVRSHRRARAMCLDGCLRAEHARRDGHGHPAYGGTGAARPAQAGPGRGADGDGRAGGAAASSALAGPAGRAGPEGVAAGRAAARSGRLVAKERVPATPIRTLLALPRGAHGLSDPPGPAGGPLQFSPSRRAPACGPKPPCQAPRAAFCRALTVATGRDVPVSPAAGAGRRCALPCPGSARPRPAPPPAPRR